MALRWGRFTQIYHLSKRLKMKVHTLRSTDWRVLMSDRHKRRSVWDCTGEVSRQGQIPLLLGHQQVTDQHLIWSSYNANKLVQAFWSSPTSSTVHEVLNIRRSLRTCRTSIKVHKAKELSSTNSTSTSYTVGNYPKVRRLSSHSSIVGSTSRQIMQTYRSIESMRTQLQLD